MTSFLKKVWAWVKKWWKLLVGFLLTLGGFIVYKAVTDGEDTKPDIPLPNPEKPIEDAIKAGEERDAKLQELAEKHQARLEELSSEQEKELEELAEKPIEEVVAWFDKF